MRTTTNIDISLISPETTDRGLAYVFFAANCIAYAHLRLFNKNSNA